MSHPYMILAERIRQEVVSLDRVVQRVIVVWQKAMNDPGESAYIDSVALNLHGFYSGLERIFELIAQHVDGNVPQGERWHRDLLHQMTADLGTVRPAVISNRNAEVLDEFRRFRHVVRNVYTTNLQADKVGRLVEMLPALWESTKAEVVAFAELLEALSGDTR